MQERERGERGGTGSRIGGGDLIYFIFILKFCNQNHTITWDDEIVKVWDNETGHQISVFSDHQAQINSVVAVGKYYILPLFLFFIFLFCGISQNLQKTTRRKTLLIQNVCGAFSAISAISAKIATGVIG
jgi:hypothetical protein